MKCGKWLKNGPKTRFSELNPKNDFFKIVSNASNGLKRQQTSNGLKRQQTSDGLKRQQIRKL